MDQMFFGLTEEYDSQVCRLLPVAQTLPAGLCHPAEISWGQHVCLRHSCQFKSPHTDDSGFVP